MIAELSQSYRRCDRKPSQSYRTTDISRNPPDPTRPVPVPVRAKLALPRALRALAYEHLGTDSAPQVMDSSPYVTTDRARAPRLAREGQR